MTNEELKDALVRRTPVKMEHPVYGKLTFAYVSAVIGNIHDNLRWKEVRADDGK